MDLTLKLDALRDGAVHGVAKSVFHWWSASTRQAREEHRDLSDWQAVQSMSECLRENGDTEAFQNISLESCKVSSDEIIPPSNSNFLRFWRLLAKAISNLVHEMQKMDDSDYCKAANCWRLCHGHASNFTRDTYFRMYVHMFPLDCDIPEPQCFAPFDGFCCVCESVYGFVMSFRIHQRPEVQHLWQQLCQCAQVHEEQAHELDLANQVGHLFFPSPLPLVLRAVARGFSPDTAACLKYPSIPTEKSFTFGVLGAWGRKQPEIREKWKIMKYYRGSN